MSYLPADYDNVVRSELHGKFSEGGALSLFPPLHINMEEVD